MEPRTILIDGYNVIKNTPGLAAAERVSLEAGRDTLLTQVRAKYRHTPHAVIVVFDGDGEAESTISFPGFGRGRVVYTRRGETADEVIRRLAAVERERGGCQIVVVSNDGEVRQSASAVGHSAARADELARKLNEPDRYQRKQAMHRMYLRNKWEAGVTDAPPGAQSRSNKPARNTRRKRGHRHESPL